MLLAGSTDIGQTRVVELARAQLLDVPVPYFRIATEPSCGAERSRGERSRGWATQASNCSVGRPRRALRLQPARATQGAAGTRGAQTGCGTTRPTSPVNLVMAASWAALAQRRT